MTRGDSDHDGRGEFVLWGWRASSVKGPIVRAGVLLRLLGVSCRLIGAAKVDEDGAGASCGWQALSVKLAIVHAGVLSLVSQTGDRPCGRVAAAARRELSTHRSGEVR